MNSPIRVMLVEDHPEYRESVALVLGTTPDIRLAHQFGTADQALHFLQHDAADHRPDLILLDLHLPGLSGIDALPRFSECSPTTPIIVLTQSDREADVVNAIARGASGYLLKSSTSTQLLNGIRGVFNDEAPIDPKMARYLVETLRNKPNTADMEGVLSERELDVLSLLGEGLVKKEIALRLEISTHTVDNYMRRIYEKLQVPNAPSAIYKAYKTGILPK
ncbi:response regulator [Pontiella sp.]|uniref:response regulator n=1 Tax=Pontiella sp. TaxID=2837462 RepID=UPI0035637ABC